MVGKHKTKKRKTAKKKKDRGFLNFVKNNKALVVSVVVVLIVLFSVSGAKIFLLVNFLLGNDIVVKLNVDKEALSLMRGQEENVTFEASVTTNPFCSASCSSIFKDIGRGTIIEQDKFILKPTIKSFHEYTIKANRLGEGMELYRFTMECNSIKTFICQTDETVTTRNILVAVNHYLSYEDKALKADLKQKAELMVDQLSEVHGGKDALLGAIHELNSTVILGNQLLTIRSLEEGIASSLKGITILEGLWEKQDYSAFQSELEILNENIAVNEKKLDGLDKDLLVVTRPYNVLVEELSLVRERLEPLRVLAVLNQAEAFYINNTVKEFNSVAERFKQRDDLEKKKKIVLGIMDKTEEILLSTHNALKKEILKQQLQIDIVYDALCEIMGLCMQHPSIEERANQETFLLNKTCDDVDGLREKLLLINASIRDSYIKENYADNKNFRQNISLKIKNIKQNITREYLAKLPENEYNTGVIKELLIKENFHETESYLGHNLTPALIAELLKQAPSSCYSSDSKIDTINEFNINKIKVNKTLPAQLKISLEETRPQCCVFGECSDCCLESGCAQDPANLPVVFLHGHAFNKDVSAEYSLDVFNKLQQKLENDGYLNAGAISLYTRLDTPYGIWGMAPAPMTIKASYYFDLFHEPENYIVVQTKSESIDTYAVRLKELIDTINYKTGRQKVIIIAHSMGGLVSRRYMQIFGSDAVDKLILVGVPNKGIIGEVADYCPVVGEKLECRDMNAESLFMNKLNRVELPDLSIYNVIGIGCDMDKGMGDGIVLEKNAMLEGADNFIINGTCKNIDKLHTEMLDIDKYPEVYYVIKNALKE